MLAVVLRRTREVRRALAGEIVLTLYVAMLCSAAAACGGGDAGQDQQPAPTEPVEWATLEGSWTSAPPMPVPVVNAGVALYRDQVYVAGGGGVFDFPPGVACCLSYASVQRFDPHTNQWERLGDLPERRDRMALGVVGDTLYAVGGRVKSVPATSGRSRPSLWAYLPESDQWVERPELPAPRSGAAAVGALELLVVIGGENIDGDFAQRVSGDSVALYDPRDGTWRHAAPVPGGIAGATAHFENGLVYVVGGYTPVSAAASASQRILAYEVTGERWLTITETPGHQNRFASAVLNGRIHLVGGHEHYIAPSAYHRAFDIATNGWFVAPDLPKTRSEHAAVVIGDRLLLIGGSQDQADPNPTAEIDVFRH
jgi:non-specific serine/threonine protein kinase